MTDTIAAIATAAGAGGIGVLRVSGPRAATVAASLAGDMPAPRRAAHRVFRGADGSVIDDGLLLYFPAPHSYTGEHVVELQGHGGAQTLQLLLQALREAGARDALPGEFTERAYLNGRLDLAQAEAVADLIGAATADAALAARRSLDGELSRRVKNLQGGLTALRVHVEGALDFADEDIDWLADAGLRERLAALVATFDALLRDLERGRRLTEGLTVVLAGRPNAGKSTLLNRLAAREAAIVTELPGTTRDPLREPVSLNGVPVTLIDTAGLRDARDPIEAEGVRRARAAINDADRICYLVDAEAGFQPADQVLLDQLPDRAERLLLASKCDRLPAGQSPGFDALEISATTGDGIDTLIDELVGADDASATPTLSARARHVQALADARAALDAAHNRIRGGDDAGLAAEELRRSQQALGAITGTVGADQLLGEIFRRFCIGK